MNPQEPVIPDPSPPPSTPAGEVRDPQRPDEPREYQTGLSDYDQADADSFPASDPPAASEPGI